MPPRLKSKCMGQPMYKKRVCKPCDSMHFSSDDKCYPKPKPKPKPRHEDECENTVNIWTNICVNQSNKVEANGGDGGAGGSSTAGSASSVATSGGEASNTQKINTATDAARPPKGPDPNGIKPAADDETESIEEEEVSTLEDVGNVTTTSASTAGDGGEGGRGGEVSATQSNNAEINVDNTNVIILSCNGQYPPTGLNIGGGSRQLDIRVNEQGETFINGQKMEERNMPDGTRVYVFHSSENSKQVKDAGSENIE